MKVALVGYGAMGKILHQNLEASENEVVGIVSLDQHKSLFEIAGKVDVIIDFSNPATLSDICAYAKQNNTPVVIATTGYSESQLKEIKTLSQSVPVLHSNNYSLGVILLNKVIRDITPVLQANFDIEVVEKHHNKKIDAPSGTAKMLISSIEQAGNFTQQHGREGVCPRKKGEIGVHTIRGGTIVGEHTVIFAGSDEVLEFKHEALSKGIFAKGAIFGANWLTKKQKGLYNMEDVLF